MAEVFRNVLIPGLDDIDLCSSLSESSGRRPECYLLPLTFDLVPCYLRVTPSPCIIYHSNPVMLLLQDPPYERMQSHPKWCWQFSQGLLLSIQGYAQSHIIWKHSNGPFIEDKLFGQVGVHHFVVRKLNLGRTLFWEKLCIGYSFSSICGFFQENSYVILST